MSLMSDVNPITPDVIRIRALFVNMYVVGRADGWVLVDAGLPTSANHILDAAGHRFGEDRPPLGIVLTHAHFDHRGALGNLLDRWDVPVWVHSHELPFVTGESDYPPPDPSVGKGLMALLSPTYSFEAIDLGDRVQVLPADHTVPGLPDWRWIHTPGHAPGHISLFREEDRLLIAGDAFVTTQQESLYKVATQKEEIHGPPAYATTDWVAAEQSVRALQALDPAIAATGHGTPMSGDDLSRGLEALVRDFRDKAVPDQGRYVPHAPAEGA